MHECAQSTTSISKHQYVFICGLHRSGTSILHDILRNQPDISGFRNTGVAEDEGQHLQTVFLPARAFGGPGKFGFHDNAAMTETHPLITDHHRQKLIAEWSRYWDLSKSLLIEKSPTNIIRTRFLQAMFPGASFIVIIRHPLAVSLATIKMSKTGPMELMKHWLTVHETFNHDFPQLTKVLRISYEELIKQTPATLHRVSHFLGSSVVSSGNFSDHNTRYFDFWKRSGIRPTLNRMQLIHRYESSLKPFGYSLQDLSKYPMF